MLNDARTCMTFDVGSVTVHPEQCWKELDEIQKRKQSLPARQTTWQQCPETVILRDISSPTQAKCMSETSAARDALHRRMMELTHKQQGVPTERTLARSLRPKKSWSARMRWTRGNAGSGSNTADCPEGCESAISAVHLQHRGCTSAHRAGVSPATKFLGAHQQECRFPKGNLADRRDDDVA